MEVSSSTGTSQPSSRQRRDSLRGELSQLGGGRLSFEHPSQLGIAGLLGGQGPVGQRVVDPVEADVEHRVDAQVYKPRGGLVGEPVQGGAGGRGGVAHRSFTLLSIPAADVRPGRAGLRRALSVRHVCGVSSSPRT